MADLALIPFGIRVIALERDELERALARGDRELAIVQTSATPPAAVPALLDATQLEERTGIPSSWWMSQAREQRLPSRRIGRRVRFDYAEVMACEAVRKRAAI